MNVADALHSADPAGIAVSGSEGTYTYGQLDEDSARLGAALRRLSLAPGDRVGVVMPNSTAHILVYYAVVRAGGVVVSLNMTSTATEIERAFRLARPAVVVAAAALVPDVREATGRLPAPPHLISADGDTRVDGHPSIPELLASSEPAAIESRQDDDPASILFTSGSTGQPKGVVLTHGNVAWAAAAQASRMAAGPGDAVALAAPMHHCYGQNAVLNAAVISGAAVVLLDARQRKKLVDELASFQVTAIPGVPAMFRVLLDLGASRERLPRLRYAVSAAAELPRPVADEWHRQFGFPIHEGYGLTETSPCALYNDQVTAAPGSLGRPFDGVDARIVAEDGAQVPPGQTGELLLRGPNVMAGYFDDPDATAQAVVDGWLRTGDHARRDEHGDYWLAGRKKNIIIVSGTNVYPSEVESVLRGHPAVVDAVVVGRPHQVLGEMVMAFLHLRDAAQPDTVVRELRDRCKVELASFKRPSSFRVLESIPALTSGKPDLVALRELSLHDPARPAG
jgi:long-chain acyl-CoA synthetase